MLSLESAILTRAEDEQHLNNQRRERWCPREWTSVSESNVGKHCQLHGTEKKPMRLEGRRVHKRNQWDLMALT